MTLSMDVKNEFDRSDALDAHIARTITGALGAFSTHIQNIELRLSDVNGPRRGPADKMTRIAVTLRPSGHILAHAGADDAYDSVTRAARRARNAVSHYIKRLERRDRKQARSRPA